MRILQINSVYQTGSTGRIAAGLSDVIESAGHESYVAYGNGRPSGGRVYKISSTLPQKASILCTRLFGRHGMYDKRKTERLVRWIDHVKPDVIHLHNIHGHYLNIKVLFDYIKKESIPVVWTFHDCWPYTGHCAYYDRIGCQKWIKGCYDCGNLRTYPISITDRSKKNWLEKREIFSGVKDMQIVTPSRWLADEVKLSFLGGYPVQVIYNGIDLDVFTYTPSDIKDKLGIQDKKVVLGIAPDLDGRKGGRYMVQLAEQLPPEYHMVILSLETRETLPDNVLVLPKTRSVHELAKIYSMADVLFNPTIEDNFPTINIEALACGTPLVMFDTGGGPECVTKDTGIVLQDRSIPNAVQAVQSITAKSHREDCIQHARQYDAKVSLGQYLAVYSQLSPQNPA